MNKKFIYIWVESEKKYFLKKPQVVICDCYGCSKAFKRKY